MDTGMNDNLLSQEEMDSLLQGGTGLFDPKGETESSSPNLSLILNFPLTLSVRLGVANKSLKEVLQITPGNVIELDNYVNNPVNLFVNGKLIAQGEIVTVDESYGVKILHIPDPVARVRQLGSF